MNRGTVRRGSPRGDIPSRVGARCHLETARVGAAAYLVPVGELDLSCVKKFRETLAKSVADTPTDLVIDLRSVTFIDSTGLGLLLRAHKRAGEEGIRLHVVGSPTEIVRAVFEASGLNKVLSLVDEPPRLQGH
jgi:anti-sigma B factor antagonist